MAIEIIVDGYNLIGSDKGLRGDLEQKREQLIERLQRYHDLKGYPITVVFDGWRSGWLREVQERRGTITVVFSQMGEKADSVIAKLARKKGSGCVVVSSDREVQRSVEGHGAVAVYAGQFSAKLESLDTNFVEEEPWDVEQRVERKGNPRRLSKLERRRRARLKKL